MSTTTSTEAVKQPKRQKRVKEPVVEEEKQDLGEEAAEEIKKLKADLERLKEDWESREAEITLQEKTMRKKIKKMKETKKEMEQTLAAAAPKTFNTMATKTIALPANIIDDITSEEMRTYLVEMISRTMVLYGVDEIVVYRSALSNMQSDKLLKLLEYIETPKTLREFLFDPEDVDYSHVDKLKKMDAAHHNTTNRWTKYREGVVLEGVNKGMSLVNVGLGEGKEVIADKLVKAGVRVTLEMEEDAGDRLRRGLKTGKLVSPIEVKAAGHYWGYQIRQVDSFAEIDSGCPFNEYDYRVLITPGDDAEATDASNPNASYDDMSATKHLLIVFGERGVDMPITFNKSINTIGTALHNKRPRFEETLLITLAKLTNKLY
eukprot:gene6526-7557_t